LYAMQNNSKADPPLPATGPQAAGHPPVPNADAPPTSACAAAEEFGGPAGPEPTRYGDWEKNGRCIDF
jgi:hypothetical protein